MVLGRDEVDAQFLLVVIGFHCALVGGSRREDHRLALEVVVVLDAGGLLDDDLGAGHEIGGREGNLLLALDAVGGGAALHVDIAAGKDRNAGLGGDGNELDLEFGHLELGLDRIDDLQADIDAVADRTLFVVQVGERDRGIAMPDFHDAGVLDLLQCAGEFLRRNGGGTNGARGYDDQQFGNAVHILLPRV